MVLLRAVSLGLKKIVKFFNDFFNGWSGMVNGVFCLFFVVYGYDIKCSL